MHSLPADALKAACLRLMNVSEMMSQQQIIQPIQASALKWKQTNKNIRTKQTHSSLKPFKTIHKHLRDNFWWRTKEQMVSMSVAREISWLARNIWCSLQQSCERCLMIYKALAWKCLLILKPLQMIIFFACASRRTCAERRNVARFCLYILFAWDLFPSVLSFAFNCWSLVHFPVINFSP